MVEKVSVRGEVQVLDPVDFHGQALTVVGKEGEPFVAMKPIVEGMGLTWQPQHRKLTEMATRWGIINMVIPSPGGEQLAVCMPLRKLPGWLTTLQPSRMRPAVAELVRLYQAECDEALWAYWSKGAVINPRMEPEALTKDEILLHALQSLLEKERRLVAVEQSSAALETRVAAIEQRAAQAEGAAQLMLVPEREVVPLTTRARINAVLRAYVMAHNVEHQAVWSRLYREFRDRYRIDLGRRARHAGMNRLDMAERDGVIEDLYALAYHLFHEMPVPVQRDQ